MKFGSRPPAHHALCSRAGHSGTFVGTTRRLKELNPAIRCISLQPDAGFTARRLEAHGDAIRPSIYDDTLADEDLAVSTEEAIVW